MKTFGQFIIEARQTLASQQARQMGLRPNDHGDYYDAQGNLVAKTIKGKLEVFKGRKASPQQKEPQTTPQSQQQAQTQKTPQEIPQDQSVGNEEVKGIVITVGRFNPPARTHEQMLKYGYARAKENNYEYRIYPSRVQDKGTNPLNPSLKVQYMQAMFPDYADYMLDSEDMRTIFDILGSLYNDGFKDIRIVVGADRVGEFQSLAHQSNGQNYQFDNIEVLPSPGKDPDSDTAGAGSAAALRIAAAEGNYEAFASNLPPRMKNQDKQSLFVSVTKAMNIKENYQLYKVAPELDRESVRRNYKEKDLYSVGTLIENINTGLQGRVIRKGTNYLICLTNEGVMFKSWITSVHLPEDVYEVGTDKYREKLQRITPLHPVGSYSGVKIKETVPKNINTLKKQLLSKR